MGQDDKSQTRALPIHEDVAGIVLAPEQIDIATSEREGEANNTPVVTSPPEQSFDRATEEERRATGQMQSSMPREEPVEDIATGQMQSSLSPEEPREEVGVGHMQSSASSEHLHVRTVGESQEVRAVAMPVAEPQPSDAVAENSDNASIQPEVAHAILQCLPIQARFERGDCMVDTFIEFRSWMRLMNHQGTLVAAGNVLDVSSKQCIFNFIAAVAQNRLRQNLAREAFLQLASIDEWTRGGALDDATFMTAMGEMPGQSLDQRAPVLGQSTCVAPTGQALSSQRNDAGQQTGLQEAQEELSEPCFTGTEPASEGGEDERRQATTTCVICSDAPAVMTFVHGSSGHTACCPACAAQIQNRGYRRCPVCRQRFSSVIRNFGV